MIRVAFTLIGGGRGTGGYNYLLNVLRVLCHHELARVTPVLFLGADISREEASPFEAVRGLEIVRTPVLNGGTQFRILAAARLLGIDSSLRDMFLMHGINVAFESAKFFGWRMGLPVVAWITDFQHRRLRNMFTISGYWKRELGFKAEIAAGRVIMLSSKDAQRDCERLYPSTVGRTRAVRFAVLPGQPPSLRQSRAVADSYGLPAHFLFMPNQFSKHKNHFLVLDALTLLRSRGVDIVIASSGKQMDERHPHYFQQFRSKLDSLGLHCQLRLLGLIPYADVVSLMRASTGLLNPSLFEGWSTPVEEARSLGVPLLLSDLAVNREQVGDQARYFNPHSASALANAIAAMPLLSDAERDRALCGALEAAHARVRQFAADFVGLMTDVTSGKYVT